MTSLKDHVEGSKVLTSEELDKTLETLMSELVKTVPHRVVAGKLNAQEYLLKKIEAEIARDESDQRTQVSRVKCFCCNSLSFRIFRLSIN